MASGLKTCSGSLETRFVDYDTELKVLACELVSQRIGACTVEGTRHTSRFWRANPTPPVELLSDDPTDLVGLSDRQQEAVAADGVAAPFARQRDIR